MTNLTNKVYYLNVYSNGSAFAVLGEPGPPREWALTLKKTF